METSKQKNAQLPSSTIELGSFPDRLKHIIGNKSVRAFATGCGMSDTAFRQYLSGKSEPTRPVLITIVRETGVSLEWLLTGEGPMMKDDQGHAPVVAATSADEGEEDFVHVPRFEIAASAGGGAVVHSEQIVDYMAFRADWLKNSLGMSPGNAAVISVVGDSMEPYLADGDLILIDTGINRIENDSVYVLQTGGSLLVKRVQRKFDGTVIVKSDNDSYEPEVFRGDSVEYLKVVGRMVRRLVR